MYLEKVKMASEGKGGQTVGHVQGVVRWTLDGTIADVARDCAESGLQSLVFIDTELFDDHRAAIAMCQEMRVRNMNVLWTACLAKAPTSELLMEMRMAGCQRLEMVLDRGEAEIVLELAREYGFDVSVHAADGTPVTAGRTYYTVVEREIIAERLAGLHSVQFDLAVAYYKARRFSEVMKPLGKAMTLGFPMNELCLNLLACLGAAKHYPEMAAGLLDQARNGCPHPVVFRNRELLKSWLESGGDVKGVRLMLEPESSVIANA